MVWFDSIQFNLTWASPHCAELATRRWHSLKVEALSLVYIGIGVGVGAGAEMSHIISGADLNTPPALAGLTRSFFGLATLLVVIVFAPT